MVFQDQVQACREVAVPLVVHSAVALPVLPAVHTAVAAVLQVVHSAVALPAVHSVAAAAPQAARSAEVPAAEVVVSAEVDTVDTAEVAMAVADNQKRF